MDLLLMRRDIFCIDYYHYKKTITQTCSFKDVKSRSEVEMQLVGNERLTVKQHAFATHVGLFKIVSC